MRQGPRHRSVSRTCRCCCPLSGGNNAGHTVVTEQGKFILNLLPSGILHPDVVCVLGAGMVIDLDHLAGEMDAIEERGVKVGSENLKLSDKATISMPWHKVQDGLEEDRLAQKGAAFGSTRRGIAYATATNTAKRPCVWAICCIWTKSACRTACT